MSDHLFVVRSRKVDPAGGADEEYLNLVLQRVRLRFAGAGWKPVEVPQVDNARSAYRAQGGISYGITQQGVGWRGASSVNSATRRRSIINAVMSYFPGARLFHFVEFPDRRTEVYDRERIEVQPFPNQVGKFHGDVVVLYPVAS
jgi:hypothetical protein